MMLAGLRQRPKLFALLVVFGAILFGLVGFRVYQAVSKPGGRGGRRSRGGSSVPPVTVDKASVRRLQFQYDQVGNVESSQNVDIVAKSAGPILELLVRQGDPVRKGQVLVRVDPSQARANLLKKRSDLANAQFTFYQLQSQQQLTDVQASSGISIAAADLQAAQANVEKSQQVYSATRTQGVTTVTQAQAKLVGARAQLRQAQVDFDTARAKYERMLGLQRQGFASNADVQDTYRTMLSQDAAVDLQQANVRAAEKEVINAGAQAKKDTVSAKADIDVSRFNQVSKNASLAEAQAGTSKSTAFRQQLKAQESLVHAAEADLEMAQLQLQDTVLRSPVNGYVSDRKLDVGALASLGTAILRCSPASRSGWSPRCLKRFLSGWKRAIPARSPSMACAVRCSLAGSSPKTPPSTPRRVSSMFGSPWTTRNMWSSRACLLGSSSKWDRPTLNSPFQTRPSSIRTWISAQPPSTRWWTSRCRS